MGHRHDIIQLEMEIYKDTETLQGRVEVQLNETLLFELAIMLWPSLLFNLSNLSTALISSSEI